MVAKPATPCVSLGANNPNATNGVFYFNANNDSSNDNTNYGGRL